jgi:hypothetical protein
MLRSRPLPWLAILFVGGVSLSLPGCGESKINKANFDRVTNGMSEQEVEAILGKGEEQPELNMPNMGINVPNLGGGGGVGRGLKVKTWQDGSKTINITFKDGQVLGKMATGL